MYPLTVVCPEKLVAPLTSKALPLPLFVNVAVAALPLVVEDNSPVTVVLPLTSNVLEQLTVPLISIALAVKSISVGAAINVCPLPLLPIYWSLFEESSKYNFFDPLC